MTSRLADVRVQRAIELIWREAYLLDKKDYVEWKDLYADDAIYVIPVDASTNDFDNALNMVFDDKRLREERVKRLIEGYAISAVDAANTVRTVSRFMPVAVTDEIVEIAAGQVVVAFKRGRHDLWAADVEYTIRLGVSEGDDQIARKVIRLIDSDSPVPAAGFLL